MEQERDDKAMKRQVLSLAEIQVEGASRLLDFYLNRFEPRPEAGGEPVTELHRISTPLYRCYVAIADRVEDLEARARESLRAGDGAGEERGEES